MDCIFARRVRGHTEFVLPVPCPLGGNASEDNAAHPNNLRPGRDLAQHEYADGQRQSRLQCHQRPECGFRQSPERIQFEGPRDEREEHCRPQRDEKHLKGQVAPCLRQPNEHSHDRCHRHRDRQPIDSGKTVTDVLGDDDV